MKARALLAAILVLVTILALTTGCSDHTDSVYLHFTNATQETIEVVLLNPSTRSEYVMQPKIEPGTTSVTRSDVYPGDTCSDRGILVARDANGIELARRTGRICKGDTWVIEVSGLLAA